MCAISVSFPCLPFNVAFTHTSDHAGLRGESVVVKGMFND